MFAKKLPKLKIQVYEMKPGKKPWQYIGVPIMDVILYLPIKKTYDTMNPRVMSYRISNGMETAFRISGSQITPNTQEVERLCRCFALACKRLIEFHCEINTKTKKQSNQF